MLPLGGCVHSPVVQKIDVGGYQLQYRCAGRGIPTVVMDSGLGDSMETWDEVTPEVQKITRVCTYDRAGLGHSDPGPTPRTSAQIVKELHALLATAKIPAPYLLVGHSLGGLNVRLYASDYPNEVAGLVLVDATHENYPAREKEIRSEPEKRRLENTFGLARPAARSEFESLPLSVAEIRAAPGLPDIPLVVITAGRREESQALNEAWLELQSELVHLTPQGRQVLADDSGHYVQFDQPDIVAEVIDQMVAQIRRATTAPQGKNGSSARRPDGS